MKNTILVFTQHYLPGFRAGGPIRSVSNMVEWFGDLYDFRIITSSHDFMEPEPYQDVELNEWNKVGKAHVFYVDGSLKVMFNAIRQVDFDLVMFNSFFSPKYTLFPFLHLRVNAGIPKNKMIIAPRGEFAKSALNIKKTKKTFFLNLAKHLKFYDSMNWAFTNEKEKKEFKNSTINNGSSFILPNLPKKEIVQGQLQNVEKVSGSLRIIFLSRIVPIKNLDFAIKILAKIDDIEVKFDIYGVKGDSGYWEACSKSISKLPKNIAVVYRGQIPHEEVLQTISGYHLFFLPTKSENFGHVISESLSAGTPVLISDQTPWRDLQRNNLGWDLPLDDPASFEMIIRRVAEMDEKEMNLFKKSVKESSVKEGVGKSVKQNLNTLDKLLNLSK